MTLLLILILCIPACSCFCTPFPCQPASDDPLPHTQPASDGLLPNAQPASDGPLPEAQPTSDGLLPNVQPVCNGLLSDGTLPDDHLHLSNPLPTTQLCYTDSLPTPQLDPLESMPAALLDFSAKVRFVPADGFDTSESSCALYGLPVWPEILFTVALIGSLLQYIARMMQKHCGLDITFVTGSYICLHDLGSGKLLRSGIVPFLPQLP